MRTKRVLFICGSLNQTTQMCEIAEALTGVDHFFTPFYGDGLLRVARWAGLTERTVLGHTLSSRALAYLTDRKLQIDQRGARGPYDLVVTCSDQVVQRNIRKTPFVLVQEGMTDPEGPFYRLWRMCRLVPRWLAGTATNGLSDQYAVFCVASEGYKRHFVSRGARPEKIVVTGIPNFDNCRKYLDNDFPLQHFVLVCTSDSRETCVYEDRKAFILNAVHIADGRQLVFKLHPNEKVDRATREIRRYAPRALVYATGCAEEMIANCDVLITRYSSTAYVGLALGKEVHSAFDVARLREMTPIQNGVAARAIASVCRRQLEALQERPDRGASAAGAAFWPARHEAAHPGDTREYVR